MHICLSMLQQHLQLNLNKIKHIICPQQTIQYSSTLITQSSRRSQNFLDSSRFPLSTSLTLTHPLPPTTLTSFRPSPVLHQSSAAITSWLISLPHLTTSNPCNTPLPLLFNILCQLIAFNVRWKQHCCTRPVLI